MNTPLVVTSCSLDSTPIAFEPPVVFQRKTAMRNNQGMYTDPHHMLPSSMHVTLQDPSKDSDIGISADDEEIDLTQRKNPTRKRHAPPIQWERNLRPRSAVSFGHKSTRFHGTRNKRPSKKKGLASRVIATSPSQPPKLEADTASLTLPTECTYLPQTSRQVRDIFSTHHID